MFEAAFQAARDALIVHDRGRILHANPAAQALLGAPLEAVRGRHLVDFVAASKRGALHDHLATSDGEALPVRILPQGGPPVQVDVVAVPGPAGVVALRPRHDTRSQREAERDAEVQRLEQMNQFKTQLLNTAAHELNTPLTPLRLQSHLLHSQNLGALTQRQMKAVDVLARNVDRLSMLVSDILDVARLESGHLAIEIEDVPLRDLVLEAAQSYEETARGVGVDLIVDADDEITVRADGRRILQVIYNLVSNGIKFTPEGGRVTLRTGSDGQDGILAVEDTGLGMDEQQMGRLFQPFSRVHDIDKTAIPGTGLGLYISKGIVQQHGGRLTAHSNGPGKGASFRLALPLAAQPIHRPNARPVPKSSLVAGPLANRLRELI